MNAILHFDTVVDCRHLLVCSISMLLFSCLYNLAGLASMDSRLNAALIIPVSSSTTLLRSLLRLQGCVRQEKEPYH